MPEMASQWRVALAQNIVTHYPAAIVLLVGSAAMGVADAWSDLDFVMYWQDAPTEAQRQHIADMLNGHEIMLEDSSEHGDLALQSLSDIYLLGEQGLKIDITHKTLASLEKLIADVTIHHACDSLKLAIVHGVVNSLPLVGDELFASYRQQIGQLPAPVAERLLERYLHNTAYDLIMMIVRRDDVLYTRQLVDQLCENTLFALIILNKQYPPDRLKHIQILGSNLQIKPDNLLERIHTICNQPPVEGLPIARDLLLDTFDLAESADYDVTVARTQFANTRQAIYTPITTIKDRTNNA